MSTDNFNFLPKILNGGIAGIIGVSSVFPIDLCKSKLQAQQKSVYAAGSKEGVAALEYSGMRDCFSKLYKKGGMRILYQGLSVNMIFITPEKAIKLVGNDYFRYMLKPEGQPLSLARQSVAGACAGACQIIVTTPMELLKIRMQLFVPTPEQPKASAIRFSKELFRERGFFGLYKGLSATALRDVTFSAIYFPLFANLNSLGPRNPENPDEIPFYWSFLSGCGAGSIASFCVTPADCVKTRLQATSGKYNGIVDCFTKTVSQEGFTALFKGAGCRMMVIAPLFGIAQGVYYMGVAENILKRIN